MVNLDEINAKAKIDYPCIWEYTVIIDKDEDINKIVKLINSADVKVSTSNKTEKYTSYKIKLEVKNEKQRLEIFKLLKENTKFVL